MSDHVTNAGATLPEPVAMGGNAALIDTGPIVLDRQLSFFVGGTVLRSDAGETCHVGHAFVRGQVPVAPRRFPLVMWHGGSQTGKTFESTADGRDGFEQIFARNRYPVYILDQAGRGRGGRMAQGVTIDDAEPHEANKWNIYRLGPWSPPSPREFFPGLQFSRDPDAIRQFLQQGTVSYGPEPRDAATRALHAGNAVALFERIGPAVLVTHSNSGQYGWIAAAAAPDLVKAIVAYEPGTYAFPEGSPPPPVPTALEAIAAITEPVLIPDADFRQLARMPILLVYGDHIEFDTPSDVFGIELWRANTQRAEQFVAAVNAVGGNARIVHLPRVGITGNTHFPFADLNNFEVALHLQQFLHQHGLDRD